MTTKIFITPKNFGDKSQTRYFSDKEEMSKDIKRMMDLDIIRDMALATMAEDSSITYDLAYKIAKAEYLGEEIEIPIPPITIEEDLLEETIDGEQSLVEEISVPQIQEEQMPENITLPQVQEEIKTNDITMPQSEEKLITDDIVIPKLEDVLLPNIEEPILPTKTTDNEVHSEPTLSDELLIPNFNTNFNIDLPEEIEQPKKEENELLIDVVEPKKTETEGFSSLLKNTETTLIPQTNENSISNESNQNDLLSDLPDFSDFKLPDDIEELQTLKTGIANEVLLTDPILQKK